jgi:peptide-methionine (R)-S-oxide reductase
MATRRELLGVTVLAGASAITLWPRRQTAHAVPIAHSDAAWRAILSPAAYYILREQGTEVPFSSPLDRETRRGIYHCAGCALPLFSSATKYDSHTGWPSFWRPLAHAVGKIATRVSGWLGPKFTVPDAVVISAMSSRMDRHPQGCAAA